MDGYQDVFCRVELKYLLSEAQAAQLTAELAAHGVALDQYGRHTISNLYYDTPDYELIRRSLAKPVFKEKLRLRAYGRPSRGDTAFVEIKRKFKGVVYKRRVAMPLAEAARRLALGRMPEGAGQIGREIEYFLRFRPLAPRVLLGYDREAYFSREREDLRFTFDRSIRFRREELDLSHGAAGRLLLAPGRVLMELKLARAMPLWLPPLLTACGAERVSYSKYGEVYRRFIQDGEKEWSISA